VRDLNAEFTVMHRESALCGKDDGALDRDRFAGLEPFGIERPDRGHRFMRNRSGRG
jgi:hypothetical protein